MRVCVCVSSELKEAAERAQAQYRTEKQKRREMELKMNNIDEEVQDLKTDKESLERVSGALPQWVRVIIRVWTLPNNEAKRAGNNQ